MSTPATTFGVDVRSGSDRNHDNVYVLNSVVSVIDSDKGMVDLDNSGKASGDSDKVGSVDSIVDSGGSGMAGGSVKVDTQGWFEEDEDDVIMNDECLLFVSNDNVLVNDTVVNSLWDAMCTRTLISEQTVTRLGLKPTLSNKFVRLDFAARGASKYEMKRMVTIPVTLIGAEGTRITFKLQAMVSSHLDKFDLILGMDVHRWLSMKFDLRQDYNKRQLTLFNVGPDKSLQLTLSVKDNIVDAGADIVAVSVMTTVPVEAFGIDTTTPLDPDQDLDMMLMEEKWKARWAHMFVPNKPGEPQPNLPGEFVIKWNERGPPTLKFPRVFQMSPAEKLWMHNRITALYAAGIICPCSDPGFINPFFLIKKAGHTPEDPKYREILDGRLLDSYIQTESWTTPLISDILEAAAHASIFSNVDVRMAYFGVRVREDCMKYLAFRDEVGNIWQFKRLPFGLKNSPSVYNSTMSKLDHQLGQACKRYFDDVLECARDMDAHIHDLTQLFELYDKYNLRFNEKCAFFRKRIKFLNHWISENKIEPIVDKETIANWPVPHDVSSLQRILGLFNYYRNFIKNASVIAQPLYDLTRKDAAFKWEYKHQQAFENMIAALLDPQCLHPPSMDVRVAARMKVDASLVGAGVAVEQFIKGEWRLVGLGSKLFTVRQRQYPAIVREALGIIFGLRHFRRLLDCHDVHVYSDSKPLVQALNSHAVSDPRWMKVLAELLQHNFTLTYITGEKNVEADAASRIEVDGDPSEAPVLSWRPEEVNLFTLSVEDLTPLVDSDWSLAYKEDPTTQKIMQSLQDDDANAEYFARKYSIVDGLLFLNDPMGRTRLFIPRSKILRVLVLMHDHKLAGHQSAERTHAAMVPIVYFKKMFKKIVNFVHSCDVCARSKPQKGTLSARQSVEIPALPFQHLSIDLVTGLPDAPGVSAELKQTTFNAILTTTCLLSRWVTFTPCNINITGEELAKLFLEDCVKRNRGFPRSILSDRDVRITSAAFRSIMQRFNIRERMTTAASAESNGVTETMHRQLKSFLIAFAAHDPKRWPALLAYAEASLNNAVNRSTGFTAARIVYAFQPNYLGNFGITSHDIPDLPRVVHEILDAHESAWVMAHDNLNDARDKWVLDNTPHLPPLILKEGEKVWVDTTALTPPELRDTAHKLRARFAGPYVVERRVSNNAYKIQIPVTSRAHSTISIKYLKRYYKDEEFLGRPKIPTIPKSALKPGTFEVEEIVAHEMRQRTWYFKVRWLTYSDADATWEPLSNFCDSKGRVITEQLREYMRVHKITV